MVYKGLYTQFEVYFSNTFGIFTPRTKHVLGCNICLSKLKNVFFIQVTIFGFTEIKLKS